MAAVVAMRAGLLARAAQVVAERVQVCLVEQEPLGLLTQVEVVAVVEMMEMVRLAVQA